MKPAKIDISYVEARNRLIPEAVKYAEENTPQGIKHFEERRMIWNRLYLGRMDELARERGI